MPKPLTFASLVLVALLSYAGSATAAEEFKFTTTLTALNPVTGTITGDTDATGKTEWPILPEEGLICGGAMVRAALSSAHVLLLEKRRQLGA